MSSGHLEEITGKKEIRGSLLLLLITQNNKSLLLFFFWALCKDAYGLLEV